jgi:hypothetical protein
MPLHFRVTRSLYGSVSRHMSLWLNSPCLSLWRYLSLWLRVSLCPHSGTRPRDSGSLCVRTEVHVHVTQGLCVSALRYTSTWLRVSLCPHCGTRPRDSGSLLYPMALRINVTRGLSRSLYLANNACLQKTVPIPCVGDRTVTRSLPAGNERQRGKS